MALDQNIERNGQVDAGMMLVIFGNQLFPIKNIKKTNCKKIFMKEDYGLCTEHRNHKLKLLFFLVAMREYRDELIKAGYRVIYHDIDNSTFEEPYTKTLETEITREKVSVIHYFEIEDNSFKEHFLKRKKELTCRFIEHKSPMFIADDRSFKHCSKGKTLRMSSFYQATRKNLKILTLPEGKPIGGKWSFDEKNRRKIPKGLVIPVIPRYEKSRYESGLANNIGEIFDHHPGSIRALWLPVNRKNSLHFLDDFLAMRFSEFGYYEDAIKSKHKFLFHSLLSPILNIGLLTPDEVVQKALKFSESNNVPLNSLEGFIRQIIGWREFIRAIYRCHGKSQENSNYFSHERKLSKHWYDGNTGIEPLDDAIRNCIEYGYTHHIQRLMIIANIMTLCRIDPKEVFNWFMEMFIDSSEWVMSPNVFGMGTFADGGLFSTKPYVCGSNYILKMSDYKKGHWCDILDGLYWKFISDNNQFFARNPRLSMVTKSLDKMSESRKLRLFKEAENFINTRTI